jgi:hypothetical protein
MKNLKHIQSFGQFNENLNSELSKETSSSISDVSESKKSKEDWWEKNYERLLKAIDDIQYEDWKALVKNTDDFEGVYNSTNKNRGLYLLNTYTIDELEDLIDTYSFNDED